MKLPQNKFINPYNFIPLPSEKAGKYLDQDIHTGVINYTVTTKTPLFIPNTSSENAFQCKGKHKSYDFYSYQELEEGKDYRNEYYEPVIPGSEIRGMMRSIYETLTDSCMSVFNDSLYPERRTGDVFSSALLYRNGSWKDADYVLYKADSYRIPGGFDDNDIKENFKEGQKIYFDVRGRGISPSAENVSAKRTSQEKAGYLIKGMPFQKRKKNCYVFEKSNSIVQVFEKKDLERLSAVIMSYQEQPKQSDFYGEYKEELEKFMNGEGGEYFPVRYSVVESGKAKVLYLSPAAITKEIAKTPLKSVLGDLQACDHFANCCPACDLFGMVGRDNESGIGSKIRFSDARVVGINDYEACYEKPLVRETLGTPKLSNPEFYLVRPEGADSWNYDYYIKDGRIYFYSKEHPLKIRGRKFYCHQPNVKLPKDVEPTELNATIRPVKEGVTFKGQLYYENISEKQLRQLMWLLGSREASSNVYFKLGSGKPLGYGSIFTQILSCEERYITVDNEMINYQIQQRNVTPIRYEEAEFSNEVKKDFLRFFSLDYAKAEEVSYPYVIYENGEDSRIGTTVNKGFEWFQINKGNNIKKRDKSKIENTLPLISEKKYMEAYIQKSNGKRKDFGANTNSLKQKNQSACYEFNQKYDGVVTGYFDKGLKISFDKNGRYEKLFCNNIRNRKLTPENMQRECPLQTKVQMVYKGVNRNGFNQWEGYIK